MLRKKKHFSCGAKNERKSVIIYWRQKECYHLLEAESVNVLDHHEKSGTKPFLVHLKTNETVGEIEKKGKTFFNYLVSSGK